MAVLTNGPKQEATRQAGWRLPESLVDYLKKSAKAVLGGTETHFVVEALLLHREVSQALADEKVRIKVQLAAAELGIDYGATPHKAIVKLALLGVEAQEKARRK